MTGPSLRETLHETFRSAPLARAVALTIIATTLTADTITALIGWPGYLAIISGLVVLSFGALVARRDVIEWRTALPVSLLIWLLLAASSVLWSHYQWATLGSAVYLIALSTLGTFVALTRDTIQIVRLYGDVLRVVLAASLVLEIFSGVLIDAPIKFLGIRGDLAALGPLQGLLHGANDLGLVALLGLITFIIEWRTRSVDRTLAVGSAILAVLLVALTRSPVIYSVALVVVVATAALYLIRRAPAARRTLVQIAVLSLSLVAAVTAWLFRVPIITMFDAAAVLEYRLGIWRGLLTLSDAAALQGWGWIGAWRPALPPYSAFPITDGLPGSALNAYLDVYLQLGIIGAFVFVGMVGLAFVRSWLLAGRRRSVIFTWPALVLVLLLVTSLFESSLLTAFGWVTFVLCCVKAGQELSWRRAFEVPESAELPHDS